MKSYFLLFLLCLSFGIADIIYINMVLAPQFAQELDAKTPQTLGKNGTKQITQETHPAKISPPRTLEKSANEESTSINIQSSAQKELSASTNSDPQLEKKAENRGTDDTITNIPRSAEEKPKSIEKLSVDNKENSTPDGTHSKDVSEKKPDTQEGLPQLSRIPDILFNIEGIRLNQNAVKILTQVTDIMKQNPLQKLQVRGHTDSNGNPGFNKRLSQKRAQVVAQFLIDQGIDSTRIYVEGVGNTQPIDSTDDQEARRKNRRVELIWR